MPVPKARGMCNLPTGAPAISLSPPLNKISCFVKFGKPSVPIQGWINREPVFSRIEPTAQKPPPIPGRMKIGKHNNDCLTGDSKSFV